MENRLLEVLRDFPHWVCYQLPDKEPRQISNPQQRASVSDSNTWATYERAQEFAANGGAEYGLGFVLTKETGLTCVDLDASEDKTILERHTKIYNELLPNAYAELSPSGRGCHLWMRGNVETRKASNMKLEVYSHSRYMTVTGQVLRNNELPDAQPQLEDLIAAIDRVNPRKDKNESWDNLVIEKCKSEKFDKLWSGQWQELYPSQSEADSALVYLLAQWSNDYEQIKRIFQASTLGQRDKAKRKDYVDAIIHDALRDKGPVLDKTTERTFQLEWVKKNAVITQQEQVVPSHAQEWPMPPGLVGEIATFIYQNAIYPNIEIALAGSIAFLAGIAGRAYNTATGTGLNQYIVLVGSTSQGKEAATRGISVLSETIAASYKAFELFMGPAGIASPQGLLRRFEDSKSFVARIGEFGHWMQKINSKMASVNDVGIRQILLDIFNKSGSGDILAGSVYADRSKNVPNIKAPALTIIGDTTPEEFYKSINESNIAEGLVSRFSIVTVPLTKPEYNTHANKIAPSKELIERICKLGKICIERMASDQAVVVPETEAAREYQLAYQKHVANVVWEGEKNGEKSVQIWQRAHLRLLRTGTLLAVSENPENPIVDVRHYEWARLFIDRGCQALVGKYNAGEIGTNSSQFEMRQDVEQVLWRFTGLQDTVAVQKAWQINSRMIANKVINRRTIQLRVGVKRSYKEDRNAPNTLNRILQDMESEGILVALPETNVINPHYGADYYTASGHPSKAKYWGIDVTVLKR